MEHAYQISYGKARVPVYRVYATPLSGIPPLPESLFTGRDNILFAVEVDVEVFGQNFLPAYTHGDNSMIVATDTMKNFILRQALAFRGATLEAFLTQLGQQFLTTYPTMEQLELTGRELAFPPVSVVSANSATVENSNVLFKRSNDDYAIASMNFVMNDKQVEIIGHRCGRVGLQLLKVTGSAFTRFLRDDYTTLPERVDRPLFIYLDVYWKYTSTKDIQEHYIPSEQVCDVVQAVFHEFVSESIQHLVHEMGLRLLTRFPQMAEVSFEGQNRTRDLIGVSETNDQEKVYSDPFPAHGLIKLTMNRQASQDAKGSE